MGSKGGSNITPPPPSDTGGGEDMSGLMMMMAMAKMMEGMQSSAAMEMPQQPQIIQVPPVAETPAVDWVAEQESLKAKMRADYMADTDKQKGRAKTVHTKSLLDDEDEEATTTTKSILAGT
jgi:hypothetical protein